MAEARNRSAWDHTAWLTAVLVNANPFRDEKAPVVQPRDFHPYYKKPAGGKKSVQVPAKMLVSILRDLMVDTPKSPIAQPPTTCQPT